MTAVLFPAVVLACVELDSGREIRLSELHLESTYDGLIEGYPVGRLNDMVAARGGRPGGSVAAWGTGPPGRADPDRVGGTGTRAVAVRAAGVSGAGDLYGPVLVRSDQR